MQNSTVRHLRNAPTPTFHFFLLFGVVFIAWISFGSWGKIYQTAVLTIFHRNPSQSLYDFRHETIPDQRLSNKNALFFLFAVDNGNGDLSDVLTVS